MERKPQSVRFGLPEHKIIEDEKDAGNVRFSEAARRLLHRGAGLPEPIYLQAQVACQEELDAYVEQSELWRRQWADIGSLVRVKLPADADEETKKLVATARINAEKLLQQSLDLGMVAAALAKKMTGIGPEELERLRECKEYLADVIGRNKKRIEAGDPNVMAPSTLQVLGQLLAVIKGLGV